MNDFTFLFPAFVLKYKGDEVENLQKCGVNFSEKLREVSDIAGIDITSFDIADNNFMENELKNQLVTYLISCLYSDIIKSQKNHPTNISFLSMGIYSALYCAESLTLEEGILLIKRIYEYLFSQVFDKNYKMLAVTGFNRTDIQEIINKEELECEVVIKNNGHSYIIAGRELDISKFYNKAQEEGAMHLNLFPVSIPYHSGFLNIEELEIGLFDNINIKAPAFKVFSSVDHDYLENIQQIKSAISSNLITNIDWHKTKTTLIKTGYCNFIECGPGDSLKRISKFIDGSFKVFNFSSSI
ncbi:MAG: ACP S-malonyltransferase [Bacteroidetes bacterium]|nr:ACP S-malonyltransferase [Bacteroidota bacterium]